MCERNCAARKRRSYEDQSLHDGRTSIELVNLSGTSDRTENTEGGSIEPHFVISSCSFSGPFQSASSENCWSVGLDWKGLSIERIDVGVPGIITRPAAEGMKLVDWLNLVE